VKWVVTFAGARDHYEVPLALAEAGLLEALVTDWYSPLDRRAWSLLQRVVPRGGEYLRRRYREGLPSTLVETCPSSMVQSRLRSSRESDTTIGTAAARVARLSGSGLLAYSFYAHAAFRNFDGGQLPKVLFQIQAHPYSFERLVHAQADKMPDVLGWVRQEPEFCEPGRLSELAAEHRMSDFCIAPSTYVKKTLIEDGADPARVRVLPYGVDTEIFTPTGRPSDDKFRITFLGRLCYRKGLWHLLEAWRRLGLRDSELVIAGTGDPPFLPAYRGYIRIPYLHSQVAVRDLLSSSHICCVPSLSDSFGLVYLQALACGTPIIATENTGAADLVTDYRQGFIAKAGDVESLCERIQWCHENRFRLEQMRTEARCAAIIHSWASFRKGIIDVLTNMRDGGPPRATK
jgi:glycosyltransferase involved in cell wall biosynthesis